MKLGLRLIPRNLTFKVRANIVDVSTISESIKKLGKNHEDFLMSQRISKLPTISDAKEFQKDYGLDIVNEEDSTITSTGEKDLDYIFSNKDYQSSKIKFPHGRVNVIDYKDTHLTFVGSNYHTLPIKNIYKLLTNTKPEVILLQIRPDQILDHFKICTNSPETGYFSSTLYAKQLIRTGMITFLDFRDILTITLFKLVCTIFEIFQKRFEVIPRGNLRVQIKRDLTANNILLSSIKERDEDYYNNVYKKTILESKNNKEYSHFERLSDELIGVACFYAERNNIPIVLCDQPELVFRQNIANTHTLMQLQNIFTRSARTVPQYPDIIPQTPLALAYSLFPELFLQASDKYISTLIEYLIASQKYSRMTAFLGMTQSESVHSYLLQRDISHLADELQVAPPKGSIIRDITCEEIIEKHALLDVVYYGKDIMSNIENKEFKTSLQMIERYADVEKVDKSKVVKMKYLHFELLKKYSKFAKIEYEEGQDLLKKEFLLRMGH